ncbi:MAG TPA: MFS transporter [Acidimicrobiia bacterium]
MTTRAIEPEHDVPAGLDPRRWVTLVIVIFSVLIVALDTTVLTVSLPTILRDLDTTLPSLQWVITGYSLTFASLLVIGGRLADLFGARRMFIIGAALFGLGSLIASLSTNVPMLVLGEAFVEGVGASLMMPATLGILSTTFQGHERATAFAIWGATAGAAVAFGPVLGGWLTTDYSWRWAFRINVFIVPVAILGALLFMRRSRGTRGTERIDVPGALLVAAGMFLLVFALSEGETYGWWRSLKSLTIGGAHLWPRSMPVSVVPIATVLAVACLCAFVLLERHKERTGSDPLFEFGLLRFLTFRYGLITTLVLAMGQLGFLFVLPVFLQDARHLSAIENGIWLVPSGLAIIVGTQIGARLTRTIGVTNVVRVGLLLEALGLVALAAAIRPTLTFLELLPGLLVFGIGLGFAGSQLTNVILYDIPGPRAGAASGANTTVRQLGAALGIAVIGTLLTTETTRNAISGLRHAASLPEVIRTRAIAAVHSGGVSFTPPRGTSPVHMATLQHLLTDAVTDGTRAALLFATFVVMIGAGLSFLIPRIHPTPPEEPPDEELAESLDALGPLTSAGVEPMAPTSSG